MPPGERRRVLRRLVKRRQANFSKIPSKSAGRPKRRQEAFVLEKFPPGALEGGNRIGEEAVEFYWDFYSSLRYQRASLADDIRESLVAAARPLPLTGWRRLVQYAYSDAPLSAIGSLRDEVGGRFNIGDLNPLKYSPFPALYLASDVPTCMLECFPSDESKEDPLTYALRTDKSFTCISVAGELDSVIDLRDAKSLEGFVDVIKHLNVPTELVRRAKRHNFKIDLVRDVERLQEGLATPDWRKDPLAIDVPAPSQIFGELAFQAGIEGILYQSVRGEGLCLAIFPKNLAPSSFVEITDPPPNETVVRRLDPTTRHLLI